MPGDNNGLLFFLASNGRTWSQPQAPCDDEHFQQAACTWETAAASAVTERSWPSCLQSIRGHAPLRLVTSNCPGMLQQGTKQSMLGIPHARTPTCTYPCLDPTSTVEDNTNWVMIDLGRHYRCGSYSTTAWHGAPFVKIDELWQVCAHSVLASTRQLHGIHQFALLGVRGQHQSAGLGCPARALKRQQPRKSFRVGFMDDPAGKSGRSF